VAGLSGSEGLHGAHSNAFGEVYPNSETADTNKSSSGTRSLIEALVAVTRQMPLQDGPRRLSACFGKTRIDHDHQSSVSQNGVMINSHRHRR
jgi:hypothetical protein